MSVLVFDTYAFVKRLTAAGMPEARAEVLADEQRRSIDDRLATKADIARLKEATKSDLERAKAEINAQMRVALAGTKSEILKWMFG